MFGTTFFADNISGGGIDSYTVLMLHLDNSVIDSGYSPKTITNNSVTFSNSIYKFGGYSGQFDGTASYLSTPLVSDFQFPNDFTVDLWIYPTALPLVWSYIIGTENWSAGGAGWAITLDSLGKIGFDVVS